MKTTVFTLISGLLFMLSSGCVNNQLQMQFKGERTALICGGREFGFKEALQEQLRRHPSMETDDILKLCYQGAYGAEHVLKNISDAEKNFYAEFNSAVPNASEPLYEIISPDFIRINLRAWKNANLPPEWLFNMFSSAEKLSDGNEVFQKYLSIAAEVLPEDKSKDLIERGSLPDLSLHHSDSFSSAEKPSYRVVNIRFITTVAVLKKAAELPEKAVKVIAIDGRAASGKTSLSKLLEKVFKCGVIHMDDFFLPVDLRSAERYSEPGGNVHYERFIEEVLPRIGAAETFYYRKFDCSKMMLGEKVQVRNTPWRIVEGAYSMHPKFGNYADLTVFYDVHPAEQMRRIILRNGEQRAKMFKERWIPLEEAYIRSFDPACRADLVIGR